MLETQIAESCKEKSLVGLPFSESFNQFSWQKKAEFLQRRLDRYSCLFINENLHFCQKKLSKRAHTQIHITLLASQKYKFFHN